MPPSFIAYIDESGNPSVTDNPKNPEWFVLSAAIFPRATLTPALAAIIEDIKRQTHNSMRPPFHFRDMGHYPRLAVLHCISRASVSITTILIFKPLIFGDSHLMNQTALYQYAARFLLERVGAYCRDNRYLAPIGDGSVEIVFSNRDDLSYDEMRGYFAHLLEIEDNQTIDPYVIKPDQVRADKQEQVLGLQIADIVAGAFGHALNPHQHWGIRERSYVRMIAHKVYRRDASVLGYGVKVFPPPDMTLAGQKYYARFLATLEEGSDLAQ